MVCMLLIVWFALDSFALDSANTPEKLPHKYRLLPWGGFLARKTFGKRRN